MNIKLRSVLYASLAGAGLPTLSALTPIHQISASTQTPNTAAVTVGATTAQTDDESMAAPNDEN